MVLSNRLDVGLKEWASVCSALEDGRQILVLRKGGIHESAGEFELEHPQFVLFPTYLHQNPAMIKETEHRRYEPMHAEPARIRFSAAGEVTDIFQLRSRQQMEALEAEHIWTPPLIDMRWNYRPENPLYLLLVRAYRIGKPVSIENTPVYAGCKSWVPLEEAVDTSGAVAVVDDAAFARRRESISSILRQ
jgi:hypothetical protein